MHNGYKSGSQEKGDGEKGISEISYIYDFVWLAFYCGVSVIVFYPQKKYAS